MRDWDKQFVQELCTSLPVKGKVLKSDYKMRGSTPVIDQSEAFIAGYVDETPYFNDPPYIVFGDHTRIIKLVDFSFAPGADGVKVLKVKPEVDSKFLACYLDANPVQNLGYSRHFKLLKEQTVPLPPLNEQKRIVEILGGVAETIQKVEQQIKMLDVVAESSFNRLCGNPETYSKRVQLGEIASVSTGNTPSRKESSYYGDFIEWIKSDNLGGVYPTLANEYLSEKGMKKGRLAQPGSMLMTCIAGSLKSIGKLSIVDRTMAFNQQINAIKPVEVDDLHYLYLLFKIAPQLVQRRSTGGLKGIVKKTSLEECEIPWPPQEVREKLAEFCQEWITLHGLLHQKLTLLQELQRSLSARAFAGQL